MKAVILAAGQGKRMMPLTINTPKPLLEVHGKPILNYILESLPKEITELIIAVNYLGNQIIDYLGTEKYGKKIQYVLGSEKGSAYSFLATEKHLHNERFLIVQGDQIPNPKDIRNCLKKDLSILTFVSDNPQAHGIGFLRKDGTFRKIIEKPRKTSSHLGVDGVMLLNTDLFRCTPKIVNGEYYLSTMVDEFVRSHRVSPVPSEHYVTDFTTPEDLARIGKLLNL